MTTSTLVPMTDLVRVLNADHDPDRAPRYVLGLTSDQTPIWWDPATADTPDHWEPLQEAGVHIHPLAVDPGKAVGALAALANTVTARHRPGPARRLHPDPRFVVILSGDLVGPLLSAYGLPGYAVAARDALRIITHPPDPLARPVPVEVPGMLPPWWLAERLTDDRF